MAGLDPFGSMQGFLGQFRGFMQNPGQFLMQRRLNVPQSMLSDPRAAIQYLMNSGQMSQAQYNSLQRLASQIQQNPQYSQTLK